MSSFWLAKKGEHDIFALAIRSYFPPPREFCVICTNPKASAGCFHSIIFYSHCVQKRPWPFALKATDGAAMLTSNVI